MPRLSFQETMDRLLLLVRAGYPVIYIVSHEERRVLDCMARIVNRLRLEDSSKTLSRWSAGQGIEWSEGLPLLSESKRRAIAEPKWLQVPGFDNPAAWRAYNRSPPDAALDEVARARRRDVPELSNTVAVFFDLQALLIQETRSCAAGHLVRPLRRAAAMMRDIYETNRPVGDRTTEPHEFKTIVIVAPSAAGLSMELERDVIVLDFPLPEEDELAAVVRDLIRRRHLRVATELGEEERERTLELVAGAGRGLALDDYKLGLNMLAAQGGDLSADTIEHMLDLKAKAIQNDALTYTPHVQIELGGLEAVKAWVREHRDAAISPEIRQRFFLPTPRGVLICGVSGGGKSQLAKLIAKTFNLALLRLDVGALFGSFVGESEERTRRALDLAEVLAPVVLWLDEVDKAFSGMDGSGDNGVSSRVFGHFLTWLAEKENSVFVVATANDLRQLIRKFPEFGRKGRFDQIFWVDLPDAKARREIFRIYLQRYQDKGYLEISDEDLAYIRQRGNIRDTPATENRFKRLVEYLGDDGVSVNLTGAEIEHAVTEALYTAFNRHNAATGSPTPDPRMSARIVIDSVVEAQERALYGSGGAANDLKTLRADIRRLHPIEV